MTQRWLPAAALLLLAACATQPPNRSPSPVSSVTASPASAGATTSVARARQRARAAAAEAAALKHPLNAALLPPFNGKTEVVRDSLEKLPKIDHTLPVDNLWQRIRNGFAMPDLENNDVGRWTAWYAARPQYMERMLERSRMYLYHVVAALEKRGMPTELALLPMVESAYNPMAYSRSHASGLWQFIAPTGRLYNLKENWWYDGRRDIIASTNAALDLLQHLYQKFGDWDLALAAYNWGEQNVARAIARNKALGLPTDYSHLDMPEQTREYVPKLQALKNIISDPQPFGITLDPIPNEPYFTTVAKPQSLDVRLAAKLAEMPVTQFLALNPGVNRPLMPGSVVHRIVLPADKVDIYRANLQKYNEKKLVSWRTYHPPHRESLEQIARHFHVSVAKLREVNGLSRFSEHTPAVLVVPTTPAAARELGRLPVMYQPPIVSGEPFLVHRVRPGESLWDISRQYGVSVVELERINHVGKMLRVGDALRIPVPGRAGGEEVYSGGPLRVHRVQPGESLWSISRRYGVSVAVLERINHVGRMLRVGDTLRIPVPGRTSGVEASGAEASGGGRSILYTVRAGETLWGIARRYGVSVLNLERWNHLGHTIHPGLRLRIYR